MIDFDENTLQHLSEFENKRVVITIRSEGGESQNYFGDLKVSKRAIILKNDSQKYDPVAGYMSDFELQIIQASPTILLLNFSKYKSNSIDEEWDDQFQIAGFHVY